LRRFEAEGGVGAGIASGPWCCVPDSPFCKHKLFLNKVISMIPYCSKKNIPVLAVSPVLPSLLSYGIVVMAVIVIVEPERPELLSVAVEDV
jgi:uncharacterized membrane protein YpjA